MQIGEFARICKTQISVLRYYDKEGLLVPEYIDAFTGYRYYSEEQIAVFVRISALKQAGFSLGEIKDILAEAKSDWDIIELFEKKKIEHIKKLDNLEESKRMMLVDSATALPSPKRHEFPRENLNLPFVDDPRAVGKWKIVGEYLNKEDFFTEDRSMDSEFASVMKEIYFLPKGGEYWCYAWTNGKLLIETATSSTVNNYAIVEYNGVEYMFVDFKSYEYFRSGKTTTLVLQREDNKSYTVAQIAHKDNIDIPFAKDNRVLGRWIACGFCSTPTDFRRKNKPSVKPYFSEVVFGNDGALSVTYGNRRISDPEMRTWTKGFVLDKLNVTASAYELREIDGEEYLFIEWKSGDYIYGGWKPSYYVFERETTI